MEDSESCHYSNFDIRTGDAGVGGELKKLHKSRRRLGTKSYWNRIDDGKYGASEEYDQDYVNISDWVIVDADSSELEAEAREEMAVKEQELAEVERQVVNYKSVTTTFTVSCKA